MRNPASEDMISDSVELWDTDVCFLHFQLMGTNVRLPKMHKTPPEVDFDPQGLVPRYPHDNIVGIHLCDECLKSTLPIVCHMPESIL